MDILPSEEWSRLVSVVVVVWVDWRWWVVGLWVGLWVAQLCSWWWLGWVRGGGCGCCLVGVGLVDFFFLCCELWWWWWLCLCVAVMYVFSEYIILL